MTIRFYVDEHVNRAVTVGLRRRGFDVLTVQEDGRTGASDPVILDRATELGRVLFSQDDDRLAEASRRQEVRATFCGVVYGHQRRLTVGEAIDELEFIARVATADELLNQFLFLPL